jgi:uncharacterized membrane-anchored protein
MKLGKISFAGASLALLATQLAIVSTAAAKYLYQRWTSPRVWTRTMVYDPDMLMRGRYVSLQLMVDGCESTLPSAEQASMSKNADGVTAGKTYSIRSTQPVHFSARLKVEGSKLAAIRIPEAESQSGGQMVTAWPGSTCAEMRLDAPVDFYIAEHSANPAQIKPGQELWVEVTVPRKASPQPIQLALKDGKTWKPLGLR